MRREGRSPAGPDLVAKGEFSAMKHLQRIPVLPVLFVAAVALLPLPLAHFLSAGGPPVSLHYAPYNVEPRGVQTQGSEIEVLLKNWEYTQMTTVGGGGGTRPRD